MKRCRAGARWRGWLPIVARPRCHQRGPAAGDRCCAPEPLSVGDVQLTWSTQGAAQPWELTFTLPVNAGGIVLEPHETVTLDGVSVTLEEFEISPSIVVWTMSFDGLDPDRSWAAVSRSLTRNGEDAFAGEAQIGGPHGEDQMQQLDAAMRGIEETERHCEDATGFCPICAMRAYVRPSEALTNFTIMRRCGQWPQLTSSPWRPVMTGSV